MEKKRINIQTYAKLGCCKIKLQDFINLKIGSTIKLDRVFDGKIYICANNTPIAVGQAIVSPSNRIGISIAKKFEKYNAEKN